MDVMDWRGVNFSFMNDEEYRRSKMTDSRKRDETMSDET
jgi:hypothetical protein